MVKQLCMERLLHEPELPSLASWHSAGAAGAATRAEAIRRRQHQVRARNGIIGSSFLSLASSVALHPLQTRQNVLRKPLDHTSIRGKGVRRRRPSWTAR